MKIRIPFWQLLVLPCALVAFGSLLNILVVTANNGTMPVVKPEVFWWLHALAGEVVPPGAMTDEVHKIMVHTDHLKLLGDWIQLPRVGTASIGDVFMWLGDAMKPYVLGAWFALIWKKHEEDERARG